MAADTDRRAALEVRLQSLRMSPAMPTQSALTQRNRLIAEVEAELSVLPSAPPSPEPADSIGATVIRDKQLGAGYFYGREEPEPLRHVSEYDPFNEHERSERE
jgi:hypothetical protein